MQIEIWEQSASRLRLLPVGTLANPLRVANPKKQIQVLLIGRRKVQRDACQTLCGVLTKRIGGVNAKRVSADAQQTCRDKLVLRFRKRFQWDLCSCTHDLIQDGDKLAPNFVHLVLDIAVEATGVAG